MTFQVSLLPYVTETYLCPQQESHTINLAEVRKHIKSVSGRSDTAKKEGTVGVSLFRRLILMGTLTILSLALMLGITVGILIRLAVEILSLMS